MSRTIVSALPPSAGVCLSSLVAAAFLLSVCLGAEAKKPAPGAEEAAVRAAIDSYVADYNRGDAKAVAAHWGESGQWVSPSGQRFQGREAIEKEMQSLFKEEKGVHIEVANVSIRLISPDVALEEGTVRMIHPSEPPSESTYLAVNVKEGGQWKLSAVRETAVPEPPTPSAQLEELAWLVGEWVDDSPEVDDTATVTWTKNRTFLTYQFKVSVSGTDDLEGTQVIGWDPAAGTIRSWMFDSDGGFGEGTWSKKGNDWIVKFSQVLPDGRKASATNIYAVVAGNSFTWKSIGRKVDGEFMPNIEAVKMVRKTTGQAAKESGKATAAAKPRRSAARAKK